MDFVKNSKNGLHNNFPIYYKTTILKTACIIVLYIPWVMKITA